MNLDLSYLLATGIFLVGLACGHAAAAPPAERSVDVVSVSTTQPLPVTPAATAIASERLPATPSTTPTTDACVEIDGAHVTLEGRVIVDATFEHPTHGKTRPYVLRLDTPRCVKGSGDSADITEIGLALTGDVKLSPFVGQHVRISGDPFGAHTAWHARPVLLMVTTVRRFP